ncbi:hypothetical protein [Brochothrix thermosphacta]|uniref:hypothetical protein n=1 Tax=Brochothrix thermosphacta TaxID=2756 RepID=UPI003B83534C
MNCGFHNKTVKIIKHGTKLSRITLNKTNNLPTYLFLKKQRFLCKACNTIFIASTSMVKRNCFISKRVIQALAAEGQSITSEKDIAFYQPQLLIVHYTNGLINSSRTIKSSRLIFQWTNSNQ